jgi:hypothetical protein
MPFAYNSVMSQIHERRFLQCPYNRARELLAEAVADAVESGTGRTLRLTLPIPGGTIAKDVLVEIKRGKDPMGFDEPWALHWDPIDGDGMLPSFEGTLTVQADETYHTSQLVIAGSYTPPGGAAGAAFDAAVGSHIAAATAEQLLRKVGDALEQRYGAEEKAKAAGATDG